MHEGQHDQCKNNGIFSVSRQFARLPERSIISATSYCSENLQVQFMTIQKTQADCILDDHKT
jgi:hypothetical protein